MLNNFSFFASTSDFTDPLDFHSLLKILPSDLESICQFVQNLLIHAYWTEQYGCSFKEPIKFREMQLRYISDILELANTKVKGSLSTKRQPKNRVVSICRDYALMVCTILRVKGTPARLRCGFATYLRQNHFEDHWVCEYWNEEKSKWIMVDAQLDKLHKETLKIDFDPCDIPPEKFIVAGKAWQLCQAGKEKAKNFGINGFCGLAFIKGNIIRDLFSLAKVELLAWDTGWGVLKDYITPITEDSELVMLDRLASFSSLSDVSSAIDTIENKHLVRLPTNWSWSKAPTITELYARQKNTQS